MIRHFTVNGVGACNAPEAIDERLKPCTSCSYDDHDKCLSDAQRVRDLYPEADVVVVSGRCMEPRTEYDYAYLDGYKAGYAAAKDDFFRR